MHELAGSASIAPRKQNVEKLPVAPGMSGIIQSAAIAAAAAEPLTPEQVAKFEAEGYLVIGEPQISQAEVNWSRDLIMQLLQSGKGRSEGRNFDLIASDAQQKERAGTSPQLLKPSLYCPELGKFSFKQRGLLMAKQLIGPNAKYVGDAVNYKPRQRGGPTPWHQDEAFREPNLSYQEISIWIALTNVTLQSGPMGYVPYSHKLGILPHRLYGGSKEANSIECEEFDKTKAVFCAIPAGAMIIHHCRTIHGAAVNHSDVDRLAYVLSYSTPLELRKDYRQFPWLVNLRTSLKNERKRTMIRGGALKELIRFVRSERFTPRYLLSIATFRGINRLRTLFKRRD